MEVTQYRRVANTLIRVISAPSGSFLFCHKCGEVCRLKVKLMSEELPGNLEIILRTEKQGGHIACTEVWARNGKNTECQRLMKTHSCAGLQMQ